jgi:hypothetical protein
MAGYSEDLVAAMRAQTELVKKQALFEVIQVVAVCDTYEEFKKAMYGKAIEFMREMEEAGDLKPGTADKIAENSRFKGEL